MITRAEITDAQAADAIEHGEFAEPIIHAADNVAIVLTQSWCPQWFAMERWLRGFERDAKPEEFDLIVFQYIYDRPGVPGEFLRFKERVLGNSQVPYVRYYHHGVLFSQTNYVGSRDFVAAFARAHGAAAGEFETER